MFEGIEEALIKLALLGAVPPTLKRGQVMSQFKSASVAILVGLVLVSCGEGDKDTSQDKPLTLQQSRPAGGGFDSNPIVEWAPAQASDTKTLALDITYQGTPTLGVAPINSCLNVPPELEVGVRKCMGREEPVLAKNLKIVCSGLGEGARAPIEPLAPCPGSTAFHYVNFNFPVRFVLE